ncbi:MAG: polyprenyl synthetase family protein, partial [Candidatus Thermoplasmatota archaeon]|nr:polyprenyl synthetase family protein [Candidatus Thermoplasmatota archaeon]
EEYERALEGAVSIELAHAASLIHDDVIDRDNERRGKPSFHVVEGVDTAILKGHKLLAAGFNIALSHGNDVAKLYVNTWNDILSGELDEVTLNKQDIEEAVESFATSRIFETYRDIIKRKTASLFSSACRAGAIEANMVGDILEVFAHYGMEIGMAYQLADDLVDLTKGELLPSVVLPLINKLENKTIMPNRLTKRKIKKIVTKHANHIQEMYLEEIKTHIRRAEKLSTSTLVHESPYKQLLKQAPTYIINKMLQENHLSV